MVFSTEGGPSPPRAPGKRHTRHNLVVMFIDRDGSAALRWKTFRTHNHSPTHSLSTHEIQTCIYPGYHHRRAVRQRGGSCAPLSRSTAGDRREREAKFPHGSRHRSPPRRNPAHSGRRRGHRLRDVQKGPRDYAQGRARLRSGRIRPATVRSGGGAHFHPRLGHPTHLPRARLEAAPGRRAAESR